MLKGKIASEGHAVGKALCLEKETLSAEKESCENPKTCIKDFHDALDRSEKDLRSLRSKTAETLDEDHAEIFDAHLEMLRDVEIKGQVENMIENDSVQAAYAYEKVTNQYIDMFQEMEDEYFRARAADIADIQQRVLGYLLGKPVKDLSLLEDETIVVARDLTPSDTAGLDLNKVKGFVTEIGGRTSHTAIIARALGIPAVVGAKDALQNVKDGQTLYLDATTGEIHIDPNENLLQEAKKKATKEEKRKAALKKFADKPTKTKDDRSLPLFANLGSLKELVALKENGAEGVGLFRTEFLFMDTDSMPSRDEQVEAYRKVFETIQPVIVRTLDIGGDKELPYLTQDKEENPFLGHRAIRLTLEQKDLFKTQLQALLIAAKNQDDVRIMFPMVATTEELKAAKRVLAESADSLEDEGVDYQKNIKVGIMIEIPSAALNANELAKQCDFFSIGTNDLIQYTFAADRMNEKVAYLYRPYDPVLLRLIKTVIEGAHKEGIEVGVCGEIAGDLNAALLLAGMGIDELSMSPASVLEIRSALSEVTSNDLESLAKKALANAEIDEVEKLLEAFRKEHL